MDLLAGAFDVRSWVRVEPGPWMSLGVFALTVVSALVPWVNAEVIVLTFPALARSRTELAWLVGVAVLGQMVGKCVLYAAGRRSTARPSSRLAPVIARWRTRMLGHRWASVGLVLVSATFGLPPFYVITLLAGATHMNFPTFLICGTVGRVIRFGSIGFVPYIVVHGWT